MISVKTRYSNGGWRRIPATEIQRVGRIIRDTCPRAGKSVSDVYVNVLFDAADLTFCTDAFVGNGSWRQIPRESQIPISNFYYATTNRDVERAVVDTLTAALRYDNDYPGARMDDLLVLGVRYRDDKTGQVQVWNPGDV